MTFSIISRDPAAVPGRYCGIRHGDTSQSMWVDVIRGQPEAGRIGVAGM